MIRMNLADLAAVTGKSIDEVREMLDSQDVIELKLTERKVREPASSELRIEPV